ncbi:MAG TPA: hypothetical protein VLG28_14780 [Acidimicrobiia bacterium]|jgi:hypothetical protein|nr:hypothetical protein [Acidimicrobiia bacterium]
MNDRTFLVLGGAGLVGVQVAARIAAELNPQQIVIVSLRAPGVETAVRRLRERAPSVDFAGEWGDVFLREEYSRSDRNDLLVDAATREGIFDDLLGPIDQAYERSRIAALMRRYKPDVVIDAINTATAISYQDVYSASVIAKQTVEGGINAEVAEKVEGDVESLILSQSVPQLIRHVMILERALIEAGARLYLKVGTTGTGGMGLNIPYTHSEDRPSVKLMTKAAVAFAHTGLLFLMARTAGGPKVKEIKPAALIGYARAESRPIVEHGDVVRRFSAREIPLDGRLDLAMDEGEFEETGHVELPVIDTGENGVFTRGEFEAITSIGQMEFVTPEEIAELVVDEIAGGNTGKDVVAAVDSSVLGPSYRGGVLRSQALDVLARLEKDTGTHSVALGQLGPPELSKLLWEAELLRLEYGTLAAVLAADAGAVSARMLERLQHATDLRDTITSLGLGILMPDGVHLLRGPNLRIPEIPGRRVVPVTPSDRDAWADKGWVDLRVENVARWQKRFEQMHAAGAPHPELGSDAVRLDSYPFTHIEIGAVVAWVLANELGGYRIK